jgi:hypothetical protein
MLEDLKVLVSRPDTVTKGEPGDVTEEIMLGLIRKAPPQRSE